MEEDEQLEADPQAVDGRMRAQEAIAAVMCHRGDPTFQAGIIVAQSLYMMAATVMNLEEPADQERQISMFMDRLPEILQELRDRKEAILAQSEEPSTE